MTVFVLVNGYDYEEASVEGVYDTEEKARKCIPAKFVESTVGEWRVPNSVEKHSTEYYLIIEEDVQ